MPKRSRRPLMIRRTAAVLLLCGLLTVIILFFVRQTPEPAPSELSAHPITLDWFLDEAGSRNLTAVLAPASASLFQPVPEDGFPMAAGTVWLRFSLPSITSGSPCLDLNERLSGQLPSGVEAWLVRHTADSAEPHVEALNELVSGLYLLPKTQEDHTSVYLKIPGVPSPGFAPIIRDRDAVTTLGLDGLFWPQIIMALLLLLCLIRGLLERREWRLLAGLYIGATLVTLALGVPGTPNGLPSPQRLPGLLAPGVALLLIPHVGRQMLQTRETSPSLDLVLTVTGIAGLCLALIPLLPHAEGLVRLLAIWPAGLLLCWPAALLALSRRIPGAYGFAFAVLLPPLGFLPLWFDLPGKPDFIKLLPFLTLCLSALTLTLIPSPHHVQRSLRRSNDASATPETSTSRPVFSPQAVIQDLSNPSESPDEDILTTRLARLGKELSSLFDHPLQPELKLRIKLLADALTEGAHAVAETLSQPSAFSLHEVIREAYNAVSTEAERRNISLSWYVAPQLSRQYLGDRATLVRPLKELLASAIQASDRGSVQLRAQRLPESNDPGLLMFTVSDTGTGVSPDRRDPTALLHAWNLAGQLGGSLSLSSGPTSTTVTFTVRLKPEVESNPVAAQEQQPELKAALSSALRILIVSDLPATRQLLAYYLDELPHELREARSTGEAMTMYAQAPGALIILDGELPEQDIARLIARLRAFEGERTLPPASILGLAATEIQAEQLQRAGCTCTLPRPVQRTSLRHAALRLAPLPRPRGASPRSGSVRHQEKRKLSATSIVIDPTTENGDGDWLLLKMLSTQNRTRAKQSAGTEDTVPPDEQKKMTRPETAPTSDDAPLRFLQPPTLTVRSNVGEPIPVPRVSPESDTQDRTDTPSGHVSGRESETTPPVEQQDVPEQKTDTLTAAVKQEPETETTLPEKTVSDAVNAVVPPIRPVRIRARDRHSPTYDSTPKPRSVQAVPYTPGKASTGQSPWTNHGGDWVGEPMPLGSPSVEKHSSVQETALSTPPQSESGSATDSTTGTPSPAVTSASSRATGTVEHVASDTRKTSDGRQALPSQVATGTTPEDSVSTSLSSPALRPRKKGLFGLLGNLFGSSSPASKEEFRLSPVQDDLQSGEWVGEPMPMIKTTPDAPHAKAMPQLSEQNSQPSSDPIPADTPAEKPSLQTDMDDSPSLPSEQTENTGSAHIGHASTATRSPVSDSIQTKSLTVSAEPQSMPDTDATSHTADESAPRETILELRDLATSDLPELLPSGIRPAQQTRPPLQLTPVPADTPAESLSHQARKLSAAPTEKTGTDTPLELTEVAQPALPELVLAGKGRSATAMTLPYAPDNIRPAELRAPVSETADALPSLQDSSTADSPLTLNSPVQTGKTMPRLTLSPEEKRSASPVAETSPDENTPLELTDRVGAVLPELTLSSLSIPPLTNAPTAFPMSRKQDTAVLSSSADRFSDRENSNAGSTLPLRETSASASSPVIELQHPLSEEPEDRLPERLSSAHTEQSAPSSDGSAIMNSVTSSQAPTEDPQPSSAGNDSSASHETDEQTLQEETEVQTLISNLEVLGQTLHEAGQHGDIATLCTVAGRIAVTADALRMPTLADLARCLTESDDESREGLLEATLKTIQQLRD